MPASILPTKLFIPHSPGKAVRRQRLFDCLEAGMEGVLTLVSAPAGYGKSTLISEWANQTKIPVAWLSLDSNDHDPGRFWSHFVAALQTLPILRESGFDEFLEKETHELPIQTDAFLDELIKGIVLIPQNFALVLDDFQSISDGDIQEGLFYLLENLSTGSSGFHLILSSRSDPPWPLARLRVRNQFNDVRGKDLRFTIDETVQFFNQVMTLSLAPHEISALDMRTEGWVAGLQMVAISLRGLDDISGFIQSFSSSNRYVMDYLLEEVLNRQSEDIQDFLLKTSILERLNGDLCNFILSRSEADDQTQTDRDSQSVLKYLEQNNLFLIALDDHRNWFRYHHLFADLLQNRLKTRYPDIKPKLHKRACIWFDQAGYLENAVEHALKTNELDFASHQIEAHILTLIQRGNIHLTRQWIRSLPDKIIRPRPILCLAQAWAYAKYPTIDFAEELLTQVESVLTTISPQDNVLDQEVQKLLNSQISVLQVVIARTRGESPQRQQELALDALDRAVSSGNTATQASLYYRLGLCYLDLGKHEQADHFFSRAVGLGKSSGNHYAVQLASYLRMVIAKLRGRLHEIIILSQQNLDSMSKSDEQYNLMGIDLIMFGWVHYEWNNLHQAENNLSRGLNRFEQVGIAELVIKGQFALTCVQIALGKRVTIPDLVGIAERSHPKLSAYAAALQVRIHLLLAAQTGDSQYENYAYQWAEVQQLALRDQFTYDWDIQEKLVYARVLCRKNRSNSGAEEKEKLEAFLGFYSKQRSNLEELGWYGILIEGDVVVALIFQTLGRNQDALVSLENALILAESQKFIRTFMDEGEPMHKIIQQALAAGICKRYTQELLSAFDHSIEFPQSKTQVHSTNLIDPLSKRELEVLRLLNTHLSVPEIAFQVHLAPTTVRSHVQSIYRKLDTHGRIETLQKAEELGLL